MYLYERLVRPDESRPAAAQQPGSANARHSASSLAASAYQASESAFAKTLNFVLDALFAGFPDVYRTIRDQLREQEVQVYGRQLRPAL